MKNLALKLLAFQKEVGAVKKDSVNPFFKSKYADINTYIEVVKPILSKHGLVITQPLSHAYSQDKLFPAIKTIITDSESGESLSEVCLLPENADPQKMGAIITYFRRYAIQSMLCLEAEDDDGESAKPNTTPAPKQNVHKVTDAIKAIGTRGVSDSWGIDTAFDEPFPSNPPKPLTSVQQSVAVQGGKIDGEPCHDCPDGKFVTNPKTGKVFCDKKCWLKK